MKPNLRGFSFAKKAVVSVMITSELCRYLEYGRRLGHDLTRMLGDLDAAARSLAEYLELHPEAVLKGKQ